MPRLYGRLLRTVGDGDYSRKVAAGVDADVEHTARRRAAADVRCLSFLWERIVVGMP